MPTFSRRHATQTELFDLSAAVRATQTLLDPLPGDEVEIPVHLSTNPCPVSADRVDIEQVILNLVLNARDAMPNGGTVTIEVDTAELTETLLVPRQDGYASLVVRDTGVDITPEVAAQVFDPFFTTKGQGKGVGLGLAMARSSRPAGTSA